MNYVFFAIGAVLIWGIWRAAQPQVIFTVRMSDGVPRVVHGTVTPAMLDRVREVAAKHGQTLGEVRGYPNGTEIRLRFSANFPEEARQQLRNWWVTFGWRAPRDR